MAVVDPCKCEAPDKDDPFHEHEWPWRSKWHEWDEDCDEDCDCLDWIDPW